jgi:RNA polymerase sigma-70 factor (ECF subfamily)
MRHCPPLMARLSAQLQGVDAKLVSVDDNLQDTLVQAVRDIRTCHANSEPAFVKWLVTIADHRQRDALRRAKTRCKKTASSTNATANRPSSIRDLWELMVDEHPTPSTNAARREAVSALQIGLATLPPDQRQAVQHHFLEQLSLPETGAAMSRSTDAVRSLLHRAKRRLRAFLGRSSKWFSKG